MTIINFKILLWSSLIVNKFYKRCSILQEGIEVKPFKFFIFEAVMKNFSLLFLIGLFFISCHTSDKMKHEKEVGKLNYHVKFNKVDNQFIKAKKQNALNFYNDYLGSDRFN